MSRTWNAISSMPFLGSGIGYRRDIARQIFEAKERLDFLEIVTDQFLRSSQDLKELSKLCRTFKVIPHGVSLSIGSMAPLDTTYLHAIKKISDITESPYYSEHLAVTRVPGIDIGHLSPLWFTEAMLNNVIENVLRVQQTLEKPLVLENITYPFEIPRAEMSQTDFFKQLVHATGCGILIDITNVHINSVNHGFDPITFMRELPIENLVQVHLAGGFSLNGSIVDSHSERVPQESWELLRALAGMVRLKASILEHDANFPEDFSVLLDQVTEARSIMTTPAN